MKTRRASKTADVVAAVRAAHLLYDTPIIFRDPYAIDLTSRTWRILARHRLAYRFVAERLLKVLRPVRGQILGRARYCDELLDAAMQRGMKQCVIVGAGLDSLALRRRDLADILTIYELDHPASQAVKRQRLGSVAEQPSQNLVFVPVDFEHSTVMQALRSTSFQMQEPAFFSWLGTTLYLSADAIFATLGDIAAHAAAGSEILLDYSLSDYLLTGTDRAELDALKKFVARRGEPFRANFSPDELRAKVTALGYRVIGNLSYQDQWARYFANRHDDLRPAAFSNFLHLAVT